MNDPLSTARRWERIAALVAVLAFSAGIAVVMVACGGDDLFLSGEIVRPTNTTEPEPTDTPNNS